MWCNLSFIGKSRCIYIPMLFRVLKTHMTMENDFHRRDPLPPLSRLQRRYFANFENHIQLPYWDLVFSRRHLLFKYKTKPSEVQRWHINMVVHFLHIYCDLQKFKLDFQIISSNLVLYLPISNRTSICVTRCFLRPSEGMNCLKA